MFQIRESVLIRKQPEEVYPIVSQPEEQVKWDPAGFISVKQLTSGPLATGSRYIANVRMMGEVEYVFQDVVPPYMFAHVSQVIFGDTRHEFELLPSEDGTLLRQRFEVRPHGVMKFIAPLMKSLMAKRLRVLSQEVKRYCEGG